MMRKSTLVLIIAISALMFYVGCDDNDGGGGNTLLDNIHQGPPILPDGGVTPPEAGEGPPLSENCKNCPCPFFNVPMSKECWPRNLDPSNPFKFHFFVTQRQISDQGELYHCTVRDVPNPNDEFGTEPFTDMVVQICDFCENPKGPACGIFYGNKPGCVVPGTQPPSNSNHFVGGILTETGQLQAKDVGACLGCLEEYTLALREQLCEDAGCDFGIQIPQCAQP